MAIVINRQLSVAVTLMLMGLFISSLQLSGAQIGVCYGRNGNNLPSEQDAVNLYKSNGIARMRLYDPNQNALQALRGSGIGLILDVPKTSLQSLGSDPSAANRWVQANIVPYASNFNFRYIAVGNEIKPSEPEAGSILPAMRNVFNALQTANLAGKIKVSTAIDMTLITNSFPPSNGVFNSQATQHITPIINFLKANGSPLLVNIYPYFSYIGNPQQINLNYALFQPGTTVTDGSLQYHNLFDALLDAVYASLAKAGGPNVPIVVSESGWPSAGGNAASPQNAETYYRNLVNHVKQGTPRKPGAIEAYLFAMFDENLKGAGVEQHFGLFTPSRVPKYQISFT